MDPLKRQLPPVPQFQQIKVTDIDFGGKLNTDDIKVIPGYTKLSELEEIDEIDGDPYEPLVYNNNDQDTKLRLKAIEESQAQLALEFRSCFQILLAEIKKLHESVEAIKSLNIGLQKSLVESSTLTARNVEALKSQFSETLENFISSLCGSSGKRGSASDAPSRADLKTRHSFDWDIQCMDSLVKSQGQVSSQSYLIGNINYKVLGGVKFSKDGLLSVYLYGESVRPQDAADEIMERGRFKCSVCVIDRTGALVNWNVGRVSGNFFKSKNWDVGTVDYNELKKRGFLKQGNRIKLEFTIDLLKS